MLECSQISFENEVIVLQKLKTMGINQLAGSGKTRDGLSYIILNRYGPNLRAVLAKMKYERFTIKTAVQIGLQIID
jgi:hypothetical protein